MGIIMIIFWVVLIVAIALVVSGVISDRPSSSVTRNRSLPNAVEILKARYARGEIDKTQYENMKRELESNDIQ